jgi:O-antigen/teichoic acid export membrane protein
LTRPPDHDDDLSQTPPVEGPREGSLSRGELSNRVAKSLFASSAWGFASLIVGFFGSLVLARLLTPHDFGLVAIGATLLLFTNAIGDAGLGAGMVRWSRDPTRQELSSLTGLQLGVTLLLVLGVGSVAIQFGTAGLVVAVMLLAIPLTTFQTPGRILFMRRVRYELLSVIDGVANISLYVWAIATAIAGFGVWSLATGTVVRAMVATVFLWIVGEHRIIRPSFHNLRTLRPLIGFGIQFQAAYLLVVLREILVNVVTGAVAGVNALGLWSLARRLMEVPYVLVSSLVRVIFPAMAHVLTSGENPAPVIERATRLVTVVSAVGLATFAGLVPALVPVVFGDEWQAVGEIVPWATAAILVLVSIGVVTAGYLQAADRPRAVLPAVVAGAIAWAGTSAALLPSLGVAAVGIGWLAGMIAESAMLARRTRSECGARVVREVAVPLLVGAAGCAVGGILAISLEPGLTTALLAAAAALATVVIGLTVLCYRSLVEAIGQLRAGAQRVLTPRAT